MSNDVLSALLGYKVNGFLLKYEGLNQNASPLSCIWKPQRNNRQHCKIGNMCQSVHLAF